MIVVHRSMLVAASVACLAPVARADFMVEPVFSDAAYEPSSIALDSEGIPHISFVYAIGCDLFGAGIRYGSKVSGSWVTEAVLDDDCPLAGSNVSMVIGGDGTPHLVSRVHRMVGDVHLNAVTYAHRTPIGWEFESIWKAGNVGIDPSLAIDANEDLHLSYGDQDVGALKYATKQSGGSWTVDTVDSENDAGNYSSLALDPDGNPWITYSAYQGSSSIRLAHKTGATWTTELIESSVDLHGCTTITFAGDGSLHIAYSRPSGLLVHGTRTETGWQLEEIPVSGGAPGADVKIQVDSAGEPHIMFYDRVARDLRCMVRRDGTWAILDLDTEGDVGRHPSFVLDSSDQAHVSYYDATNDDMKYARGEAAAAVSDISGGPGPTPLLVFPNPSRGGNFWITPQRPLEPRSRLVARDATGRVVHDQWVRAVPGESLYWKAIDRAGQPLPSSLYFLELRDRRGASMRATAVLIR